jgi:hypothetical protein
MKFLKFSLILFSFPFLFFINSCCLTKFDIKPSFDYKGTSFGVGLDLIFEFQECASDVIIKVFKAFTDNQSTKMNDVKKSIITKDEYNQMMKEDEEFLLKALDQAGIGYSKKQAFVGKSSIVILNNNRDQSYREKEENLLKIVNERFKK